MRVLREIVDTHRDVLIPQRESVVARSQEQQNYMIIGVFELIQAKRQEYDAYQSYLEAIRDYWLARTDLMRAVGARLPSESAAMGPPGMKDRDPVEHRRPVVSVTAPETSDGCQRRGDRRALPSFGPPSPRAQTPRRQPAPAAAGPHDSRYVPSARSTAGRCRGA